MDKERIYKDDANKAIKSSEMAAVEAQKQLNDFQGQMNTILTKRPPLSTPDELKKSLANFREEASFKGSKEGDYFLNDFQFDMKSLKPLNEHSITEPSVIDEPIKTTQQMLKQYNLHNPPQELSQRLVKQEHKEETTSLFNLRTSTNESEF